MILDRPAHRSAACNPPPAEVARYDPLINLDRPVKSAAVAKDLSGIILDRPGHQSTLVLDRPGRQGPASNPGPPPAAVKGESTLNLDRPNRPL